jgi:uncharacterized spore protein YtfJ
VIEPDKVIINDYVMCTPVKAGEFTIIPLISITYGATADQQKGGFFGRLSPKAVIVAGQGQVKLFNLGYGAIPEEVVGKALNGIVSSDCP